MAASAILTISGTKSLFSHMFARDLGGEPEIQVPAIGDWLEWCQRYHEHVNVDSFLSYVHQTGSPLIHQLKGTAPAFGPDVISGLRNHYQPFLSAGVVRDVYHVQARDGVFVALTHMSRYVRGRGWSRSWDVAHYGSVGSVHAGAAGLAFEAAKSVRAAGYTDWEPDPEGTALDFDEIGAKHSQWAVDHLVGA